MVLPGAYAEGEDRLVNVLNIKGKVDGLIKNYRTLVDAHSGRVWSRENRIVHHVGKKVVQPMGFVKKAEK